ncbi:MAG: hypothetical protein CMJ64_26330 [Planctomycetaceae bacterium]|nr:hypothetical protein [Planctomycetaceae bacterium]
MVEESGENKATVNKCRQFAEVYSPAEFKELCKLRRQANRLGHVTKLLTVPVADKGLRKKLQTRAAKEGWTARQLDEQIQGNYESESSGMGRRWTYRLQSNKHFARSLSEANSGCDGSRDWKTPRAFRCVLCPMTCKHG